MFNLADDEVILTHRGQTLNEIERFDDPRSEDEDDDDNALRSKGHLDGNLKFMLSFQMLLATVFIIVFMYCASLFGYS